MRLIFHTADEGETIVLGATLAGVLRAGDVLALDGELGAGKTRLVRGLAEGLGLDPASVNSPTYVIIHEYDPPPNRPLAPPLYHVDAYRLGGPDELESLGWDRISDGSGIVAVEWASRIGAAIAQEPSLARVHIDTIGPEARRITLLAPPAWRDRAGWSALAALSRVSGEGGDCAVCGRRLGPDDRAATFCSEKCRMVDLGRWLTGKYVVSRELRGEDMEE